MSMGRDDMNNRVEQCVKDVDVSKLCRLCANPRSCLIPIFEEKGLEQEIDMKIYKYLPVKVTEDDVLPAQVCNVCISTMTTWHNYFIQCLVAEKKLQALVAAQHQQVLRNSSRDSTKCAETGAAQDKDDSKKGAEDFSEPDGRKVMWVRCSKQSKLTIREQVASAIVQLNKRNGTRTKKCRVVVSEPYKKTEHPATELTIMRQRTPRIYGSIRGFRDVRVSKNQNTTGAREVNVRRQETTRNNVRGECKMMVSKEQNKSEVTVSKDQNAADSCEINSTKQQTTHSSADERVACEMTVSNEQNTIGLHEVKRQQRPLSNANEMTVANTAGGCDVNVTRQHISGSNAKEQGECKDTAGMCEVTITRLEKPAEQRGTLRISKKVQEMSIFSAKNAEVVICRCDYCPEKFERMDQLERHMAIHNCVQVYHCHRCENLFVLTMEQFQEHADTHSNTDSPLGDHNYFKLYTRTVLNLDQSSVKS